MGKAVWNGGTPFTPRTARPSPAAGAADGRARLMGAVRAACRRLGLDDDDRRHLQREVTGKASLAEMSLGEIGRVLDRLNKDWKGPSGHRAYLGKIKALWWTLHWLGAVAEPGEPALAAFVQRQTGKERLAFLGHKEAFRVIEALKDWAARAGVEWPDRRRLEDVRNASPTITEAQLDRHAVLAAQAARLQQAGATRTRDYAGYLQAALGLSPNHWSWTGPELDAGIRLLGKLLRRAPGEGGVE